MDDLPSYLARLVSGTRIPISSLSSGARRDLQPLFAGGALVEEAAGRGSVVVVRRPDVLLQWAHRKFPAYAGKWEALGPSKRAQAVLQRRDSKAGGATAGPNVLHLRAGAGVVASIDDAEFPVGQLTERHGVAACLIQTDTKLLLKGTAALIENLVCFLEYRTIIPSVNIALNSSGRVSEALVQCLSRSSFHGSLLHLPDYDPVGLADYLRLKARLGDRVQLFVPADLESRFAAFGNTALIAEKPRNRSLLEAMGNTSWPCAESAKVFRLIRDSGSGLEQESLLLSMNGLPDAT